MNAKDLFLHLAGGLTLNVDQSEKEAMIFCMLKHRLDLSATEIHKGKIVSTQASDFKDIIDRLNREEPLQYILGAAEFYGRNFEVSPSVLIPRPETEILVSSTLKIVNRETTQNILDIGTGSGCIAITLAKELPYAKVMATDISNEALAIAKRNARQLGVQVQFHQQDVLTEELPFLELDIVVSNPPYIREQEKAKMNRNVLGHEPALALFVSDSDPLIFHRAIANQSKRALRPGGLIILEINEHLGRGCITILRDAGFSGVAIIQDLDKKDRFVMGYSPI